MVGLSFAAIIMIMAVLFGLMFVAGLLVIAAKRSAVAVIGAVLGLLLLAGAGIAIAGIIAGIFGRQVAATPSWTDNIAINTYPEHLQIDEGLPAPDPMLSPQPVLPPQPVMAPQPVMVPGQHSSTSYHTTWRIAFVPIVLILGLFAVVVVGVIRQLFRKRQECGRSGWGALTFFAAIIGVPVLFLLFRLGIHPVETYVPNAIEVPLQGGHHAFSESMSHAMQAKADAAERIREHQQRVAEMMNRRYTKAGSKLVPMHQGQLAQLQQERIASAEEAKNEAAQRIAEFNSQLKHFIATVDINELIAMFEAPKIELPPVSPEARAITASAIVTVSSPSASPPLAALAMVAAATNAEERDHAVGDSRIAAVSATADSDSHTAVAEHSDSSTAEVAAATAVADTSVDSIHAAAPTDPAANSDHAEISEEHTASAEAIHGPPTADEEELDHSHEQAAAVAAVGDSSDDPNGATTHPEPNPLPHWARDPDSVSADSSHQVITTDEYATTDECRRATDIYLMLKTAERVHVIGGRQYLADQRPSLTFHGNAIWADGQMLLDARSGASHDYRIHVLQRMGIGIDQIRRAIVRDQEIVSRESPRSFATMYKQYTLVEFTPEFDKELRRHWNTYRRGERFAVIGVGAASALGLLTLVFGLLKIDTWTKGYYTKRLFLGVPAAIIGGIAMFVFLIEIFH